MKTTVLTVADTRAVVRQVGLDALMDQLIHALERAFRAHPESDADIPVRDGFEYGVPEPGLLEWMPLRDGARATLKVVGYHPGNPARRGMPTVLSTLSAYATGSGHLLALMDATLLTALRTGAASAVASRALASPRSRVLGLVGCGAQAVTQLHAVSRVFPLSKVLVHDSDAAVNRSFASRVAFLGIDVEAAGVRRLVGESDIVCTATSVAPGEGPVFADQATRPWLHVNAVGSDFPGKVELPRPLLERSFVTPDYPEQALREGECQQLRSGAIGPPLAEVVRHAERYRHVREAPSVFDSTGWALEDRVAMDLFMDHARELGLGTELEIESVTLDPHDPYQFLRPAATRGHAAA